MSSEKRSSIIEFDKLKDLDIKNREFIQKKETLENEKKGVGSGLVWHCENDVTAYRNVVSVLLYLRIDEGIKQGNLRYKDKNNNILHNYNL